LFSALTAWAGRSAAGADSALVGLSFCDMFAGSGAVGLEAASRGAGPVLLVEADRRAAAIAARNSRDTGLAVSIRTARVERLVGEIPDHAYDAIFADPPYDQPTARVEELVHAVVTNGWLGRPGLMIIERSSRTEGWSWPSTLTESWQRKYGETTLHFAAR
jgi:16S rRNA (guanine966-N2)-methyltransferase